MTKIFITALFLFTLALSSILPVATAVAQDAELDIVYAEHVPLAAHSLMLDVIRSGNRIIAAGERGHMRIKERPVKKGLPCGRQIAVVDGAGHREAFLRFTVPTYGLGGYLMVIVDGLVQEYNVDYTETSTTSITFATGLSVGDRVTVRSI